MVVEVSDRMCMLRNSDGEYAADTSILAKHWQLAEVLDAALERHRRYVGLDHETLATDGPWSGRRVGRVGNGELPMFCESAQVRPDGQTSICGRPFGHGYGCDVDWDTETK
jgi:hypothetical protein